MILYTLTLWKDPLPHHLTYLPFFVRIYKFNFLIFERKIILPTAQGGWEAYKTLRMPPCKESVCTAGDTGGTGSMPGSGRSPGEGNGNLLQHSCLKNPMDRGTWGRKESDRTEQLSMHANSLQLCWTLWNPMDCSLSGFLWPWDSPDKNTGVGFHALLQDIFLTQESNMCPLRLLYCRQIFYLFHHRGSLGSD